MICQADDDDDNDDPGTESTMIMSSQRRNKLPREREAGREIERRNKENDRYVDKQKINKVLTRTNVMDV